MTDSATSVLGTLMHEGEILVVQVTSIRGSCTMLSD
jgi:hypothetical protein